MTKSSPVELYPELVSAILSHLFEEKEYDHGRHVGRIPDMPELGTCMQVSQLWHAQALPYRFRRVSLRVGQYHETPGMSPPGGYDKAEARIRTFLDLCAARPEIAGYVRELNIFFLDMTELEDDDSDGDEEMDGSSVDVGQSEDQDEDVVMTEDASLAGPFIKTKAPMDPPSLDGIGQVLPTFCRSLIRLEKLWLGTHNWSDIWWSGTPELREAVRILCASPSLTSLRGCDGIPIQLWCYNPSLTHVQMDHAIMDEDWEVDPSLEYAPLKGIDTRAGGWLKELLHLHPGLLRCVEELRIATNPLETANLQQFLDATANTIATVVIEINSAMCTANPIVHDFSKLKELRTLGISYLAFLGFDKQKCLIGALSTLSPSNNPKLETARLKVQTTCAEEHFGYPPDQMSTQPPNYGEYTLALDQAFAPFTASPSFRQFTAWLSSFECMFEPKCTFTNPGVDWWTLVPSLAKATQENGFRLEFSEASQGKTYRWITFMCRRMAASGNSTLDRTTICPEGR